MLICTWNNENTHLTSVWLVSVCCQGHATAVRVDKSSSQVQSLFSLCTAYVVAKCIECISKYQGKELGFFVFNDCEDKLYCLEIIILRIHHSLKFKHYCTAEKHMSAVSMHTVTAHHGSLVADQTHSQLTSTWRTASICCWSAGRAFRSCRQR